MEDATTVPWQPMHEDTQPPTMSHKTNLVHHVLSKLDASVLGWAAASLLLFVICRALYLVFLHPLSKVPGPRLAKITELWRTNRYIRGYWHRDILDLHRKYGPVVRISPNEVSIVSPELSKTVYSYSGGTQKVRQKPKPFSRSHP
jgi:hypothetical protein